MSDTKCNDCGLPLLGICQAESGFQDYLDGKGNVVRKNVPEPEHKDRCCDCFDERMGMPASSRNRARPA